MHQRFETMSSIGVSWFHLKPYLFIFMDLMYVQPMWDIEMLDVEMQDIP
jgi:hypothetical protein